MKEILLKCPITGQRKKIEDPEGEPTILDPEDASDLPPGWGEVIVRRVVSNPSYLSTVAAREARGAQLIAQIDAAAGQMGASEAEVAEAREAVPGTVDREMPLPAEFVTVEWAFGAISPDGMDSVADEAGKLGLVMQPLEPDDEDEPGEAAAEA